MSPYPQSISRPTVRRRRYAPLALGLSVALTTGFFLLPSVYRTRAGVVVGDTAGRSRSESLRTAADLALSTPVLTRAATSLLDAGMPTQEPSVVERFGVALGIKKAPGKAMRIKALLASHVRAVPSEADATLQIVADAADAMQAARIASAVADALVAERDQSTMAQRGVLQAGAATRIETLRAAAAATHRRLASLGDVESVDAKTEAAARASVAEARVSTLRATIASGSPPLGDAKDMPALVATLQTSYLDLSRKLAIARETLGDRHTTIIALNEGVRRAGAELTAEWKRALRIAEAELAEARQHEASLSGAGAPDAKRQAALVDARRAARMADDAVVRAEAAPDTVMDGQAYRLGAPAPVPAAPVGWPLNQRILLALLAGVTASMLAFAVPAKRREPAETDVDIEPTLFAGASADARPRVDAADAVPGFFEPDAPVVPNRPTGTDVADVFALIVTSLEAVVPTHAPVPTIMVAAREADMDTSGIALGLGRVAAGQGLRVLLVEAPRACPVLAAAVAEPADEPMLVEVFDALRIVLPVEATPGLFVAPILRNGAAIAAALARNAQAAVLYDIARAFDVIIVDGGRAADSAAAGWAADAYLRVANTTSRGDIAAFLETFDADADAFLGSVAPSCAGAPAAPAVERPRGPSQAVSPQAAMRRPTSTLARAVPQRIAAPARPANRYATRAR